MTIPVILTSGDYTASITPFGAELCSLKYEPGNTEFIWQADKTIWPRHSPILFPFVGRLKNFEYRYNGKAYTIEQHGFARDLMFEVIQQKDESAVFELTDNDYTWQRYPFRFSFKVKYLLENNKLTISFEVANKGQAMMPVSFGGHPAFNITDPNDALIIFENDANPLSYRLEENFISNKTRAVTDGSGAIWVNEKTFVDDALVFKDLRSRSVVLNSRSNPKSVKVSIDTWPYLGIWSKPGARFICIEPWQGIADALDFEGDVSQKEGIIMLPAYGSVAKSFVIEVTP